MTSGRWIAVAAAGWIAVAGGPPSAAADDSPARLVCRGNEPFWSLEIEGERARHERLGEAPLELTGQLRALDFLRPPELVWRGRGAQMAADVVVFVTERHCRDTMSDGEGRTEFSHQVRVSMPDGEVLVGCCALAGDAASSGGAEPAPKVTLAELAARPVDDWTRLLGDMLPATRACLARTEGPAPRVTKAWPMSQGRVGVRTRNGEGGRFGCVAPMVGGAIDRFEPTSEGAARVPGEGLVLFTSPVVGSLTGECYEHERVVDERDEVIGWLAHDVC